ncbi:NGFI-A-binding protein 1 isoform X2 [Patella vulgata]|uniref:NGFI-A-binding protein 1 isoform X2 n=1 Tax=Patella vulgata TaxID=6465 RepID=UPI0024A8F098|nr:NGFI-A-binding protein 1 isoform X2 [Patella vulgata]
MFSMGILHNKRNTDYCYEVERYCCPPSADMVMFNPSPTPPYVVGQGNIGVTMTTAQPSNSSEWQLYRVLQRANLLQYYEIFIAQGGDDVQQLCEAGEEEFLEIMALVGMASKPLHVRRLQKSLQEWVTNPGSFQNTTSTNQPPAAGSITAVMRDQAMNYQLHSTTPNSVVNAPTWNPTPRSISPASQGNAVSPSSSSPQTDQKDSILSSHLPPLPNLSSLSPMMTPVLVESQINAIADAAAKFAKEMTNYEPKDLNLKKQINREIQAVMLLPEDDPNRMEELRKYAAIYGRFDSKRKNDRPMSLHEMSVNEASAQLCRYMPSLLTRREDLFPLARQVVRNSGYQYSKGHSRGADIKKLKPDSMSPKQSEYDRLQREERLTAINTEFLKLKSQVNKVEREIEETQESGDVDRLQKLKAEMDSCKTQQMYLMKEQSEIIRRQKRYLMKRNGELGYDGEDYSSSRSPNNSNDSFSSYYTAIADSTQATGRFLQDTLFDEGLRIAQQYGMSGFAEELKELQSSKPASSIDGENSGSSDDNSDSGMEDGQNKKRKLEVEEEEVNNIKHSKSGNGAFDVPKQNGEHLIVCNTNSVKVENGDLTI